MENEKVFNMPFAKVYPLLVNKAVRKGRTPNEVAAVTQWLTGYTPQQIDDLLQGPVSYGDFFRSAPAMNPDRARVTGSICGVRIEGIEDPLMQDIRRLDKLVDELAKGKPLEKVLHRG